VHSHTPLSPFLSSFPPRPCTCTVYRHDFTATSLPLDGEYDPANALDLIARAAAETEAEAGAAKGDAGVDAALHGSASADMKVVTTKVYRHGVTNDIRDLWMATAENLGAFRDMDDAAALRLREVLAKHKLIASSEVRNMATTGQSGRLNKNKRQEKANKTRKRRNMSAQSSAFNSHLKGGHLEHTMREDE
jgi:hypothetical protein